MLSRWIAIAGLLVVGCDDHIIGETIDTASGPAYADDWLGVQDFFTARCVACHRAGGSADFDLKEVIESDLADDDDENNLYVVPSNSGGSILWQSISWTGTAAQMPAGAQAPLPASEIGHVQRWIDAGAPLAP